MISSEDLRRKKQNLEKYLLTGFKVEKEESYTNWEVTSIIKFTIYAFCSIFFASSIFFTRVEFTKKSQRPSPKWSKQPNVIVEMMETIYQTWAERKVKKNEDKQ